MDSYLHSRDWADDHRENLTRDVAFNRKSFNLEEHVSPSANGNVNIGTDNIVVRLVQGLDEEQFKRTMSMTTRATVGLDANATLPGDWEMCDIENPVDITCDKHDEHRLVPIPSLTEYSTEYGEFEWEGHVPYADWEEMLKGGLQTALETQVVIFAVSGVSRTCTHQLVRSRRASFHQQSQRASYSGDQPDVRMPESVWLAGGSVRRAWLEAISAAHNAYRAAVEADVSYQDARFILPEGTESFILCEYPLREFINTYAYRGCSMFQWEIVKVFREMRRVLIEAHPWLEPHIKISCEKTGPAWISKPDPGNPGVGGEQVEHHCTFQGWEQVEGQCDFTWAKEEARTFKPQFHQIKRNDNA